MTQSQLKHDLIDFDEHLATACGAIAALKVFVDFMRPENEPEPTEKHWQQLLDAENIIVDCQKTFAELLLRHRIIDDRHTHMTTNDSNGEIPF